MVKKLQKMADKKEASPAGLFDSQLAQTVKDSAHQIWLAGLGAFAKAQGGGGKVFEMLMKEGLGLQRKTQAAAEEKLGDMAGKMTAMAGEVGHKANAQWDKLESIFEERTARALGKLGVPSAKQLASLSARLDALTAAVAQLGAKVAPAKAARARPGNEIKRATTPRKAAKKVAPAAAAAPAAAVPAVAPAKRVARKRAATAA